MTRKSGVSPKEHYRRLRIRSCEDLWREDVAAFDRADARERMKTVAVIRAVGVVFSESGTAGQRERARGWLRSLLGDPEEKVRRYAIAALPKIGSEIPEETTLLDLLDQTSSEREKKSLGRALEKIGAAATLERAAAGRLESIARTAQKAAGNLARQRAPGFVRLDAEFVPRAPLAIHLRGRRGSECLIEREIREQSPVDAHFRIRRVEPGLVIVEPEKAFAIEDLLALRCFGHASFALGTVPTRGDLEALAAIIASPLARSLFEAFTDGPLRYRLEFVGPGHRRSAVRQLGDRVYALAPDLINDSRDAPWQIDIHRSPTGDSVELSPRLRPDPRFAYRLRDVPAASHPPLAAGLARLAGPFANEIVWDPFCGSGLELIESARRGHVSEIFGSDRSGEAIEIARANFGSALTDPVRSTFAISDFRDHAAIPDFPAGDVSLVITNPPLGRRVPVPDLRGLISALFAAADAVLRPGGRLVLVNPLPVRPDDCSLALDFRQKIDLGGFHAHLEKYVKARPSRGRTRSIAGSPKPEKSVKRPG